MILQRVMEHVRAQNWVAVALDFIIVVSGVFIGIQVANWNDARATRITADEYHERLVADLQLEAKNYRYLQDYYHDVRRAAETTYAALTGEIELSDTDLLINAFRASQYNFYERYRSTFDELVASGNLDLIDDPDLRKRVTGYYAIGLLEEINAEAQRSEYRIAFRKTLPPYLHAALADQCGDKTPEDAPPGVVMLNYECSFDWPQAAIAQGASMLRANEELPSLLRLRIANLISRDMTLDLNFNAFGLEPYLLEEGTK